VERLRRDRIALCGPHAQRDAPTVHKGEMLHGGQAEEIFEDMLYDQYALEMSKNANMGMAKMLYDQLSTIRR
jgi:Rod binding domain-containing protein